MSWNRATDRKSFLRFRWRRKSLELTRVGVGEEEEKVSLFLEFRFRSTPSILKKISSLDLEKLQVLAKL